MRVLWSLCYCFFVLMLLYCHTAFLKWKIKRKKIVSERDTASPATNITVRDFVRFNFFNGDDRVGDEKYSRYFVVSKIKFTRSLGLWGPDLASIFWEIFGFFFNIMNFRLKVENFKNSKVESWFLNQFLVLFFDFSTELTFGTSRLTINPLFFFKSQDLPSIPSSPSIPSPQSPRSHTLLQTSGFALNPLSPFEPQSSLSLPKV